MSSQDQDDLTFRNLLRMHVLEVADELEQKKISASKGAARLRSLADADIQDMDEADIEIDFDAEGGDAGPLLALAGGKASSADTPKDPVEAALGRVVRFRDRNNGLKIVAETPGAQDIEEYKTALEDLRQALNDAASRNPAKE